MSALYEVRVDGQTVYAASDLNRFLHEVTKKWANVSNAVLHYPEGYTLERSSK